MKHVNQHSIAWICGALLLAACSSNDRDNDTTTRRAPGTPTAANAPAPEADLPPLASQDDLDASAAQSIDAANADAELQKLEKELSGGGG